MKNGLIFGSLLFMGAGSFQLATGRASGPYTIGLSAIFIGLGILGLIGAAAIPARPQARAVSPQTRIAIALTVLCLMLGLLIIVAVMANLEGGAPEVAVSGYVPQQPPSLPVPAFSAPPPPALAQAPSPPQPHSPLDGNFGAVVSSPPRSLAKPAYTPPANQPGEPTELVGGPEGWQFQAVDRERRPVIGFRYVMGSWGNQPAVAEFTPLFSRTAHAGGADVVLAREGYVVGGLEVAAEELVNATRVLFVRQRTDGTLDPNESYVSDWIGNPAGKTPREIGDGVTRVIGICGRHGAVKNALALILDKGHVQVASSPGPANRTENKPANPVAAAPRKRSAVPAYEPPPGQPGTPTELAGGPEGWQFQSVDPSRQTVIGFRFRMGSWAGEPAVAQFEPLYRRDQGTGSSDVVLGRNGYVVGGLQVVAGDLINAVRIIFVRQKAGGSLDRSDFYLSDWIGDPGDNKPQVLGDGQSRVIGICGRNGAVKNAIALVLDMP